VHFEAPRTRSAPARPRATDCGDCVTVATGRQKKTLCFTYLPIAKSFGAKIFVQCDVQTIEKVGDTWKVNFELLDHGAPSPVSYR